MPRSDTNFTLFKSQNIFRMYPLIVQQAGSTTKKLVTELYRHMAATILSPGDPTNRDRQSWYTIEPRNGILPGLLILSELAIVTDKQIATQLLYTEQKAQESSTSRFRLPCPLAWHRFIVQQCLVDKYNPPTWRDTNCMGERLFLKPAPPPQQSRRRRPYPGWRLGEQ